MLKFKTTNQFERDYKLVKKQGRDDAKLQAVMQKLFNQEPLDTKHPLTGNWKGHRDCHIEPDWVLIYRIDKEAQTVTFIRTGSHADIFG
ncbi:MAG: type II toxin-antitoxin system YafQ family toxin [Nitrospirae bacterium]|nr:type II toxin-antitoxin system YafQ family toxin [Nitrospirota bacterium]